MRNFLIAIFLPIFMATSCKNAERPKSKTKAEESTLALKVTVEGNKLVYIPAAGDPKIASWNAEIVPQTLDIKPDQISADGELSAEMPLLFKVTASVMSEPKPIVCTSETFSGDITPVTFTCDGPIKNDTKPGDENKPEPSNGLKCTCLGQPVSSDLDPPKKFSFSVKSPKECEGKNWTGVSEEKESYRLFNCSLEGSVLPTPSQKPSPEVPSGPSSNQSSDTKPNPAPKPPEKPAAPASSSASLKTCICSAVDSSAKGSVAVSKSFNFNKNKSCSSLNNAYHREGSKTFILSNCK